MESAGDDFQEMLEDGLQMPALVSRSAAEGTSPGNQAPSTLLRRDLLLSRDGAYSATKAVRVDLANVPSSSVAKHAGFAQIGFPGAKDRDAKLLSDLATQAGIHLSSIPGETRPFLTALELASENRTGTYTSSTPTILQESINQLVEAAGKNPELSSSSFRLLGISLGSQAGGVDSAVARAALACSIVKYVTAHLSARGLRSEIAARQLHFSVPLTNSFWLEIGFLRALRVLLASTQRQFNVVTSPSPLITAVVNPSVVSEADTIKPGYELIRYSAIATAALLGGADMVSAPHLVVLPHENHGKNDTEKHDANQRLLASTQLALIHESGLNTAPDAAAGSYYAEAVSRKIATMAWDRFVASGDQFESRMPTHADFS